MKQPKRGVFNGIDIPIVKRFRREFTELFNDDHEAYLVSKKMYHNEDPDAGLVFDYRYAINVCDVMGFTGEPVNETESEDTSDICINLYLIPEPKDWCEEALKKAAETIGYEDEPIEEMRRYLDARNAIDNGYAVLIAKDAVSYPLKRNPDGYYDPLRNRKVVRMLDTVASLILFYENTIGFAFDKPQNRIGTTGWDVLEACLHGGDAIQKSLKRLEEK